MSGQTSLSAEQLVKEEIGSSTGASTGHNDEEDGWKRWIKVFWGLIGTIASALAGFLYWWLKQLCRIDCHWIYQEDPECDVVCSVEAESVFNRLHPARRQLNYLPVTRLSLEQKELLKQTLPPRKRSIKNFWLLLPKLRLKLRHNSSYSFNSRTLIHSSFSVRAIKMTPNSSGSMMHMLQKAEAKRLFRREGDSKSFFSRASPRIAFTENGIVDKASGYPYAEWDPISLEDYQAAREKLTAAKSYLPVVDLVKMTASGFIEETVLTMEPSMDSEMLPSTSSGLRIN